MHQTAPPEMTGAVTLYSSTTQAHRLDRVRIIASAVNLSSTLETILDRVLSTICSGEPWSRGGIMAVNRVSGFSELVVGYHPGEVRRPGLPTVWSLSSSPALYVAETRQPLVIADAQAAAQFAGYQADALARGYRTVILLPLGCRTDEGHDMVLSIHTPHLIEVSEHEIDFLVTTAHLVAIAVEKSRHLQRERRQNERLRSVLDRDADLMGLVLGGADMAAITSVVGAMLADPFVIIDFIGDATVARQSAATESFSDREWAALVEGPAAPLLGTLVAQAGTGGADVLLDLSSIGRPIVLPAVVEPLRIQGETVGGLLVFPRGRRLDDIDRLIVQEVRFALGAHMMQRHVDAKRAARDVSDFFEQLCRGGIVDPAHAQARARRLGLDLNRPCFLLAVALPKPITPPFTELRHALEASLGRANGRAFLVDGGEVAAIGFPVADAKRPIQASVIERAIVQPILARWGVRPVIACGPCCQAPDDYPAAWTECGRVLDLARVFCRDGVLRQVDFGPSALLLSAFDSGLVAGFLEETLGALRAYDGKHGTTLLGTAITVVDEGGRHQVAADRLGIHVSTLRYRLRRIRELSGLDVADPEARFRLSLATRLSTVGRAGGSCKP